jgi:hypothetical protein
MLMKQLSTSRSMRVSCLLLSLLLPGLAGCRHGQGPQDAYVRLINAAPGAQDLSVAVDGQRVWKHSQFRSNTGYQGLGQGSYEVSVDAQGNEGHLTGRSYLLCQKGKAYTVVAVSQGAGGTTPPILRVFDEDKDAPVPSDKSRLRFINAGGGLGPVDVLFNNIVGIGNTTFGSRSQAVVLNPGGYDVKVIATGDVRALAGPLVLHFLPGHAYTLVVMGRREATAGPGALTLEAYPDDH